jgi:hypothetical protein
MECFDLETEDTMGVPPRGILQTVRAAFDAIARRPSPAPFAHLGVVEGRERLSHDGCLLNQWHLNAQRTKIEDIANEIGVSRVLDAKLYGDPHVLSQDAKRYEPFFVVWAMLAIDSHEIVGVLTQDVFQPTAINMEGDRHANNDVPLVYALFQRLLLRHGSPRVSSRVDVYPCSPAPGQLAVLDALQVDTAHYLDYSILDSQG